MPKTTWKLSGDNWDHPRPAPKPNPDTQKKPPAPSETQFPSLRQPSRRWRDPRLGCPRPPSGLGSDAVRSRPRQIRCCRGGRTCKRVAAAAEAEGRWRTVWTIWTFTRCGRRVQPGTWARARRRGGRRCGPGRGPGPLRATSRRGCRPCALGASGPRRRSRRKALRPPSFYRVVSWAAGAATLRGDPSADAGHRAAAAGSSLAAASLPIVGGGRRALPASLGPAGGAACAVEDGLPPCAPSPAARSRRKPGRGARRPSPCPWPCRSARFLRSLHFVSLSSLGRLMEGRVHGPRIPRAQLPELPCPRLRQVSGVAPSFSLLLSLLGRRLRCGHVCNKSFDFRTHDRV